ncbi:MAG: hypothetical protein GX221_06380 [Candidatus Riflebacteria bacterium]|nr:hypothetical protein [Candidatus Riflebacteria bacterium]
MTKRKAITLTEIMVSILVISLLSVAVYKILSSVFTQFSKNTSKLSNVRTASKIFERLKIDIRAAVPYSERFASISGGGEFYKISENEDDPEKLTFYTNLDEHGYPSSEKTAKVSYTYEKPQTNNKNTGIVRRTLTPVEFTPGTDGALNIVEKAGATTEKMNELSVTIFDIKKVVPDGAESEEDTIPYLRIWLMVQGDEGPSSAALRAKNAFQLSSVLFPRFFEAAISQEEEFWQYKR